MEHNGYLWYNKKQKTIKTETKEKQHVISNNNLF